MIAARRDRRDLPRGSVGAGAGRAGARIVLAGVILAAGVAGCAPGEIETTYGRSRGRSINGTNAVAEMIRAQGHPVRAALRYNDVLAAWAEVVVRFAPAPGPPGRDEARWLSRWLNGGPGRKLVYIPRDYQADAEFWAGMLAALPPTTPDVERKNIEAHRDRGHLPTTSPPRANPPASIDEWFGTEPADRGKPTETTVCKTIAGPWAAGVDPAAAALPCHEAIRAENSEDVLLEGDGRKLVVSWTFENQQNEDGAVLVVANGSFLLNAGLLTRGRRPLASRVVDWIGAGPSRVAFVEGADALDRADAAASSSPFHLLSVPPFGWITAHLAVFGTLLCLALAATIGRPRPEPLGEIERPSAHPIALGARFARTRQAALAHELIANYRRWRHPSTAANRTEPPPSSPSPSP